MLAIELAYWEAAKDSNSATELRAYLERYPSGEFTALANARLDALEDGAHGEPVEEPEPVAVELSFWETVKDSGKPEMLKAYVEEISGRLIYRARQDHSGRARACERELT